MLYKKKWPVLIFILPGLIFLAVFLYYPFVKNLSNSVYQMTTIVKMPGKTLPYIGLDNYKRLLSDPYIRIALKNSFLMMILTVVFEVGLGLVFAILIDNIKRAQGFFRTVFFFPVVISAAALGVMFNLFYMYNGGALNQVLGMFGAKPVNWLQPSTAFIMIVIPTLWSYVGFYFVIMLTGIADISDDIYEAAAIDGCTKLKAVFYITVPLLKGVICTCVTLAVTGALKVFDLPWMIAEGGAPQGLTHFLGTYMYQTSYGASDWDYASTIALFIVVVGVVVAQLVGRLLKDNN